MTIAEFVAHLRALDVKLSLDAGFLRCNAPEGVMTPTLRAEINRRKEEILLLLHQANVVDPSLSRMPPAQHRGSLSLSLPQQRLWFVHQLRPDNPSYNLPIAYRITGFLNIQVLERSINEIICRHEILRTVFPTVDGQPEQVIIPTLHLTLPQVSLSGLPGDRLDEEIHRLAVEHFRRPFDLVHGPLIRPLLLCLGESEHVLLLSIHHIVFDGRSLELFMNELAALYQSFVSGQAFLLPQLPVQYADYTLRQQDLLRGGLFEKQLLFWKQALNGLSELELPTDLFRPAVQSGYGQRVSFSLSEAATAALKSLGIQEKSTNFMVLLASFQVLLHFYSGQEDLIVGCPIDNRRTVEVENLIGFFVNTIVIRTSVSADMSFREVLGSVREGTLRAYAHADLPFERVVEELRPQRSTASSPLAAVGFTFSTSPLPSPAFCGLQFNPIHVDVGTAQADLTLSLWETPKGFHGSVEYCTDLFSSETIMQLSEDFKTIAQTAADNPDLRISDFDVRGARALKASRQPLEVADDTAKYVDLTETQLLVWMGQQLEPEVPLYNVPYLYKIPARVDRRQFAAAFQALFNYTDAMRLVFEEIGGIPRQRLIEAGACQIEHLDFSREKNPEESCLSWAKKRSQRVIDLEVRPFDSVLAKISGTNWIWYLNMHHIAVDAWSYLVLFKRLQELYRQSAEGRKNEPLAYPQFMDFIALDRAGRNSPHTLMGENYWKRKLNEQAESISFYGKPPVKRASRVRRVACDLGWQRTRRLKAIAKDPRFKCNTPGASLFNIFLGLLAAYLHRISGVRNVSVGAPFANRRSSQFREVVGLLMQVVPLRVRVEGGDTFLSLIHRAGAEAQEASKHSTHTIGNFRGRNYDVLLNFLPMTDLTFDGAEVEIEWLHPGRENDSLSLHVSLGHKKPIHIYFDCHCDVFQEAQVARVIQHFLNLMDAFLDDPGLEVERVSLLSSKERHQIITVFNVTDSLVGNDETLPALFESQVLKTPESPAVCFGSSFLTYSSLNGRANQVAQHLRGLGVGPETVVGLCLDRSPELIAGMLGILKAGGAYLPLDPTWPEARLSFMVKDTGTRIILTRDQFISCLPNNQARIVSLDRDAEAIGNQSKDTPISKIHPDCLAYVIYTSGSTGLPKGVMITHRAICNRLVWEIKRYRLNRTHAVLQHLSPCFDVSVWEIFIALLTGARLIIYKSDTNLVDVEQIAELIRKHSVTVAGFVPSMLEMLLDEQALDGCTSLGHVLCGGEPLSSRLQTKFESSLSARLINAYGPTEATVSVTHWTCIHGDSPGTVPIGRPISNTRVYILDEHFEPVPQGVAGELFIGGAGVARGYFNRPALTAERFLPDPFSPSAGGRLYRTGDLARHLPNGSIEFLGRVDDQIKLRGFRIEPGEVRAVLEGHPSVERAVVLAEGGLLLSFVTPRAGPCGADLRDFLRKTLPDYMVPSRITRVEAFPLTPSGKVDKAALLALDAPGQDHPADSLSPKGDLELTIALIWKEVLRLDTVGSRQSFFDLGGHSLLLAQVHSRLQRCLGRTIPLLDLFRYPTISSLARYLEQDHPHHPSQTRSRAKLQVEATRRQALLARKRRELL